MCPFFTRESWQHLLGLIRNREQRLQAAGEIHRFHRDVAEALSRIQEKEAALPEDLGRDLNSVLALIRRHEGFENDLVALEAQLQVLVEDASRLQAHYPGNNAVHIDQQQQIVVAHWEELKERSAHRRDQLQASCDLQRFLTQVAFLSFNAPRSFIAFIIIVSHGRKLSGERLDELGSWITRHYVDGGKGSRCSQCADLESRA